MKLSEKTLQVIKNFSNINQSLLIRPGNVIKTVTDLKTIFARAEVQETFETEIAIYDLRQFLGTISLFEQPEFDFDEKFVTIYSGKQRVKYTYANTGTFTLPPSKEINFPETNINFDLSKSNLSTIIKACDILQVPEIAISGEDNLISIRAVNTKDSSSNSFSIDVGECTEDFNVILKPEYLTKIISSDYVVSLTTVGISRFVTDGFTYWVATNAAK